ncbi:MAG: hypothetical protein HFH95_11045 [Lachnospiraceae bacterium]|nr:bacterial transcriptional activator domain-containing protein [uncultured Acetatifactor sp.]MCI8543830.1 hypothetical protein [Lachnospiraceae bacterium]
MEETKTIHFELLGSFSCREARGGERKNTTAGRKALSFLQYLIVNHARNVATEELIGQFWADQSSDPANALKNMVYKSRNLLKNMLPEEEELIVTLPGCYVWNPEVPVELDSELFEQACLDARKHSGREYLEYLMKALALYKGDFLSGNDSDWAVSLRRYYQTLYLDICKMTLPLLHEQERWAEMISICEQAAAVDFGTDTFIVYQMQALIAMGQPERASRIYQSFRELLWQEFEIEPSEQVEQMHMLAESMCQSNMSNQDILKLVAEKELDGRAFFCTFSVFRSMVALERRHMARSGLKSTIATVSLGNKVTPTTDARRLERVLLEGLRTGDPVARLDAGSYILMLTGAGEENALMVMERIDRTFHKIYSHSKACISFRVLPLEPAAHPAEETENLQKINVNN